MRPLAKVLRMQPGLHLVTRPVRKARAKIPGNCKCCGAPLTACEMSHWVVLCETAGVDPVFEAIHQSPPGIHCDSCSLRGFAELCEDGDTTALRLLRKLQIRGREWRVVSS